MCDPFGITPTRTHTRSITRARVIRGIYTLRVYSSRGFIPRRGIKISLGFSDPGPRRGPASSNPRRGEVGEIFSPEGGNPHAKPAHTRASTASERAPRRTYASSDASVCARGYAYAYAYVCTSACTRMCTHVRTHTCARMCTHARLGAHARTRSRVLAH